MEQRKRINAKQNAKGDWQIDCTVEITESGQIENTGVADEIVDLIRSTEAAFSADGRRLAGS